VTKNDTCPNPNTFSIITEENKNDTTWKLDFQVNIFVLFLLLFCILSLKKIIKVFQQASIITSLDLLNEIQRRYNNSIPCPYIRYNHFIFLIKFFVFFLSYRQMNVTKCCLNWTGSNCDQGKF
jgi:hypothetical protein